MTKQEYLSALRNKLKGLPSIEVEEKVEFYSEMIDDYMIEGGISEEELFQRLERLRMYLKILLVKLHL